MQVSGGWNTLPPRTEEHAKVLYVACVTELLMSRQGHEWLVALKYTMTAYLRLSEMQRERNDEW